MAQDDLRRDGEEIKGAESRFSPAVTADTIIVSFVVGGSLPSSGASTQWGGWSCIVENDSIGQVLSRTDILVSVFNARVLVCRTCFDGHLGLFAYFPYGFFV